VKIPQITATKFVAFGDSITEGQIDSSCPGSAAMTLADALSDLRKGARILDPTRSYPTKLLALLSLRYPAQTITVFNAGLGGETVDEGSARLPRVLTEQGPPVLLLQEGANDMTGIAFGSPPYTVISIVVNGLRSMIREARRRGITVFVGTLLPQRPGACRGYAPAYIGPANDQIRAMVAGEGLGVTLVDLYAAFGGVAGDLLGTDGLHPNEAGYQKMAQTFFDSIQQRLEMTLAASLLPFAVRGR
jgi:lysophospholipase L1-like esterase